MIRTALMICLGLVVGEPALAYCTKPDAPFCANRYGNFSDQFDFEACKRQMVNYKSDVETYLICQKRETDQALQDYNDAVESFNRRARS